MSGGRRGCGALPARAGQARTEAAAAAAVRAPAPPLQSKLPRPAAARRLGSAGLCRAVPSSFVFLHPRPPPPLPPPVNYCSLSITPPGCLGQLALPPPPAKDPGDNNPRRAAVRQRRQEKPRVDAGSRNSQVAHAAASPALPSSVARRRLPQLLPPPPPPPAAATALDQDPRPSLPPCPPQGLSPHSHRHRPRPRGAAHAPRRSFPPTTAPRGRTPPSRLPLPRTAIGYRRAANHCQLTPPRPRRRTAQVRRLRPPVPWGLAGPCRATQRFATVARRAQSPGSAGVECTARTQAERGSPRVAAEAAATCRSR